MVDRLHEKSRQLYNPIGICVAVQNAVDAVLAQSLTFKVDPELHPEPSSTVGAAIHGCSCQHMLVRLEPR